MDGDRSGPRLLSAALATAVVLAVIVGIGYALQRPPRARRRIAQNPVEHAEAVWPVVVPASGSGLDIDEDGLFVDDVAAWFTYAPSAIEEAIRDGARGADGVLVHMLRRTFPRLQWPPREDSPIHPQWNAMVRLVAESLNMDPDPSPIDKPRLHVVS